MRTYQDEYTKDKKIAEQIRRKYFRSFYQLHEELVQLAVIGMWRFRVNPLKRFTVAGVSKVAHNAMVDFLRREFPFLNDKDDEESDLVFDPIVDGLIIEEEIKGSPDFEPHNVYAYYLLKSQVYDVLNRFNYKGKQIIRMYLNRRSFSEIAKCCDTTKPNVQKYVRRFREAVADKLAEREVA